MIHLNVSNGCGDAVAGQVRRGVITREGSACLFPRRFLSVHWSIPAPAAIAADVHFPADCARANHKSWRRGSDYGSGSSEFL